MIANTVAGFDTLQLTTLSSHLPGQLMSQQPSHRASSIMYNPTPQQQQQQQHLQRRTGLPVAEDLPTSNNHNSTYNANKESSQTDMPCLSSSVSGPSTMGYSRTLPQHDFDFRSDVSVLSVASAQEAKAWFCGSCSYRNSDMYQTTCALCGCARCITAAMGATNASISGAASVSSSQSYLTNTAARQERIFTIDSSISLLSHPNPSMSVRSVASCSRTTGTSNTTKVMSNCTNIRLRRPSTDDQRSGGPLRKPRCEDKEEEGCIQPPTITHALRATHLDVAAADESDDDDDDDSLASQDTCRMGSLSSSSSRNSTSSQLGGESGNESADDSLDSQRSRRKVVPHEDPMEMQPRHRRRHHSHPQRRQKQQQEGISEWDASPVKPIRRTDTREGIVVPPAAPVAQSSTIKKEKKKSIKDFIPGLRRRRRRNRRRSSDTTTTTAASSTASNSSGGQTPVSGASSAKTPVSGAFSAKTDAAVALPLGEEASCSSTHGGDEDVSFHTGCGRSDWCQAGSVRRSGWHAVAATSRYGENYY